MEQYKTIKEETVTQFVEKRSRFICYCCPIKSEEEANEYIKNVSSKHWDAKHNVYAYRIRNQQIERYSDDGEPQGTAGIPVLNVLKGVEVQDIVVVITRYFGGILLGTGGLVRAYSKGAKLAVENSKIVVMKKCKIVRAEVAYGIYGKVENVLKNFETIINNTEFLENVTVNLSVETGQYDKLEKKLNELSSGEILIEVLDERYCSFK